MNRIKSLRQEKNIKQIDFCKTIGVSQAALSGYETGKYQPDLETLKNIANYFNVSTDYLLGNTDQTEPIAIPPKQKGVKIPVLGYVQAGIPFDAIEEIIDYEEISEQMAKNGEYFGLQVRGASMEPKFSEGDVVIIRKQPDIENGQIAVVIINGDRGTLKKVQKSANGITLISTNPAFEPMFYNHEQIKALPITIAGKVVELRAKFY